MPWLPAISQVLGHWLCIMQDKPVLVFLEERLLLPPPSQFSEMSMTHIDGLVQDCSNSSALALELLQSCTISHQVIYVSYDKFKKIEPYLCRHSMWACREEFSDTSCLEASHGETEGCAEPRPSCTNHHRIVGVVHNRVVTGHLQYQRHNEIEWFINNHVEPIAHCSLGEWL